MRLGRRFFLGLGLAILLASGSWSWATGPRQVLIIDLPRLTFNDLSPDYPHLYRWANQSAAGVVTSSLAATSLDQVYLEFNTGGLVLISRDTSLVLEQAERYRQLPAGTAYQMLTGFTPPLQSLVQIGWAETLQLNSKPLAPSLGLLGQILHQHGCQTAAVGNLDADRRNRSGALMLLDQRGRIDQGWVGRETLKADPAFPWGWRTNSDQIEAAWQQLRDRRGVTVITLGDLERIERFRVYLSQKRWQSLRQQTLTEYDQLLGRLGAATDPQTTLMMLYTGMPPQPPGEKSDRLTPILLQGPGVKPGLLYSPSTRRPGLVTNNDLVSTTLNFLGIKNSKDLKGRSLGSVPGKWQQLAEEQENLLQNYRLRWPLLTGYGYLLIGLILVALVGLIFGSVTHPGWRYWSYIYLGGLTLPAVFLVEAVFNPSNWPEVAGITLVGAILLFLATFYPARGRPLAMLSGISLVTVLLVLVDGCSNGLFEINSFLGYSAVTGARFYGIGNEYLGVFLGAYLALVSLNLDRLGKVKSRLLWLATAVLALFLAHPSLGANIGGGITALLGLGITTYLWLQRPIHWREVVVLAGSLVLMLLVIGLWDLYCSGNRMTHFGQMLSSVKHGDFKDLVGIIARKWQLNLQIFDYTPWTKVLLGVLMVIPLLYHKPPRLLAQLQQEYPGPMRGFLGMVVTAIVALLVNDTGIVSAAMLLLFGFGLLLLLILDWPGWNKGVDQV